MSFGREGCPTAVGCSTRFHFAKYDRLKDCFADQRRSEVARFGVARFEVARFEVEHSKTAKSTPMKEPYLAENHWQCVESVGSVC